VAKLISNMTRLFDNKYESEYISTEIGGLRVSPILGKVFYDQV